MQLLWKEYGRWWQYAVSPGTFLTAFPSKAWIRCLYDGSAYNETEKVTGKCALVGTFQSTGIRNTFGRWDENARKLRTLEGGKATTAGETLIQGALEAVTTQHTFGK